ncbi:uncharacterized protein At4g14100-like [Asparagus officinalis]|uniref:uncharacterized protein At4g14100-like n=1 Tax=Asparagus officinalis TaxID=4686 RepID=UPI00098E64A5|nr:uncharacterized protein At4g14100-like [Asparagus officinalis]
MMPLLLLLLLLPSLLTLTLSLPTPSSDPTPAPWPHQFHSVLFMNYSGALSLIDLWYDWPMGRNFNIMQDQLGGPPFYPQARSLGFLHWDGGEKIVLFETPRDLQPIMCFNIITWSKRYSLFPILSSLIGPSLRNFRITLQNGLFSPVGIGRSIHVMTFEVGAVLEDEKWQAPVYCFDKGEKEENTMHNSIISEHLKRRAIQKKATTLSKL